MNNTSADASTLFLGHNGEFWDFCLILSVIAAAFVAAAIGATTAGSVISHKREAAHAKTDFDKYKVDVGKNISDANDRVAAAKRDTSSALERIATLTADAEASRAAIAGANERAAEANLKAEAETVARLKLEAALSPRRIPPLDVYKIMGQLGSAKDAEIDIISYEYLDSDVGPLARTLESIFLAVEAKPVVFSPYPGSGWARGVVITTVENAPPETESLANEIVGAMNSVGIASARAASFKADDSIAGAYSRPNGKVPKQKLRILVGSKP